MEDPTFEEEMAAIQAELMERAAELVERTNMPPGWKVILQGKDGDFTLSITTKRAEVWLAEDLAALEDFPDEEAFCNINTLIQCAREIVNS